MAFDGFSKNQLIQQQPSSGTAIEVARFTRPSNTVLNRVGIIIYKHGIGTGSESFDMFIKQNLQENAAGETKQSVIAQSETISFSDITDDYWIGFVRFDFDPVHIKASQEYTIELDTSNYTQSEDNTFFFGWALDWPEQLNTYSQDLPPGYVELYEKA